MKYFGLLGRGKEIISKEMNNEQVKEEEFKTGIYIKMGSSKSRVVTLGPFPGPPLALFWWHRRDSPVEVLSEQEDGLTQQGFR